ncbi:hypothetical protein M5K25_023486 [Dendrobium thyrsiflorum]|uniref:Uncharacterized protein n=1 Tax=Dendrobium thyrsiflorum TaxID=117978 RepID=A0ABD0U8B5_DENTH
MEKFTQFCVHYKYLGNSNSDYPILHPPLTVNSVNVKYGPDVVSQVDEETPNPMHVVLPLVISCENREDVSDVLGANNCTVNLIASPSLPPCSIVGQGVEAGLNSAHNDGDGVANLFILEPRVYRANSSMGDLDYSVAVKTGFSSVVIALKLASEAVVKNHNISKVNCPSHEGGIKGTRAQPKERELITILLCTS